MSAKPANSPQCVAILCFFRIKRKRLADGMVGEKAFSLRHLPHFPKLLHILHPQNGKNIPPPKKEGGFRLPQKQDGHHGQTLKNFVSGGQSACVIASAMTSLFSTALCAGGSGSPIIGSLFLLPLRRVGFVVTRLGDRRAFMMIDNRTHAFHRLSF